MPANRSKNAPGPWRQSASGVGQTWQILPPTTQITTFSPRLLYRQPGSISSSARRTCPQKRSLLHPPTTTLEVSSAFPRERAYLLRISSSQSSSSSSQSSSSRVHHRLRSSRTHDAPSSPRRHVSAAGGAAIACVFEGLARRSQPHGPVQHFDARAYIRSTA